MTGLVGVAWAILAADAGAADDIEASARARCTTEQNALRYNESKRGAEAEQLAAHYREMLATCLAKARKRIADERRQQQAIAEGQADGERRRQEAQASEEERARQERENFAQMRVKAEEGQRERERREHDPAFQREQLSESLCDAVWRRSCALASIAKEKKLAKRVGVVNLRLLQDKKEELRDAEEDIRNTQREMKERRFKPQPCKPPECDD